MPEYVVFVKDEEGCHAYFFTSYVKANDCYLYAKDCLGDYAELSVRDKIGGLDVYVLLSPKEVEDEE